MRQYIVSVCFSLVVCAGAAMLVPSRKYDRTIKIICGIFIVYTLLTPVTKIFTKGDFYTQISDCFEQNDDFSKTIDRSKEKFDNYLFSK